MKKLDPLFINKVKKIATELDTNYLYLLAVMNKETAGTFSPSIKNPKSSATGLIQFVEQTAKDLGTTTAKLAKMSQIKQLDYVYLYLKRFKGRLNTYADTYLAVFYPAAISKPDHWSFPNKIYSVNKALDVNKDGKITIADFKKWIGVNKNTPEPKNNIIYFIGAGVLVYYLFR